MSHGIDEILTIDTPLVRGHARPDLIMFVDNIGGGDPIRWVIATICFMIWYVLNLSTTFRRWHDFGVSGWTPVLLSLLSAIPAVGPLFGLASLAGFVMRGTNGRNKYGDPPKDPALLRKVRQVPRHLWRGEVPLSSILFYYVFILNFLLLDKVGTTLMAGLDLSTINLLYVAALMIVNCILCVGVWRSATFSASGLFSRILGRLVAVFLAFRALSTFGSLLLAGTASLTPT